MTPAPSHFAVIDSRGSVHGATVYSTFYAADRAAQWCRFHLGGEWRVVEFVEKKS